MIDTATEDRIRRLVGDLHRQGEAIHVYRIVQQFQVNGCSLDELTVRIGEEAIRIRANVNWDRLELDRSAKLGP